MKSFFALLLATTLLAGCAAQPEDEYRMAGRSVSGIEMHPFMVRPDPNADLKPKSWSSRHYHPAQWEGMDWDPQAWNENWTPAVALARLYNGGVLHDQYAERVPVLEVGPRFYELSDLDQRRSVKLAVDYYGMLEQKSGLVELRDWHTHDRIGVYTQSGMMLD